MALLPAYLENGKLKAGAVAGGAQSIPRVIQAGTIYTASPNTQTNFMLSPIVKGSLLCSGWVAIMPPDARNVAIAQQLDAITVLLLTSNQIATLPYPHGMNRGIL